MVISLDDAKHVAKLARLDLQKAELELYTKQLNSILDYAQQLQGLDTSKIAPTFHPFHTQTVFREDIARAWPDTQKIIDNGPDIAGTSFVVPKII